MRGITEHRIDRAQQAAGGEPADLIGPRREAGVGIELRVGTAFGPGNELDVAGVVDQGQFVFRGETGRDEGDVPEFPVQEVVDHAQPVRALGMALARVVLQVPVVFDDGE